LSDGDGAGCNPTDVVSIKDAMHHAIVNRTALRERGLIVASRFRWSERARRHEAIYTSMQRATAW
jgi:hypothetical protein